MNNSQFAQWWADFAAHFPSISKWLSNTPDPKTTLELWRNHLRSIDYQDAVEVTARMFGGTLDKIGQFDYDREATATTVRRLASRLYLERTRISPGDDDYEETRTRHRRQKYPAGKIYREVCKRVTIGQSADEAVVEVLEMFGIDPNEPSDDRRDRFRCVQCRDTGYVECWAPAQVERAFAGEKPVRAVCVAACDKCKAGERKNQVRETKAGNVGGLPFFDPKKLIRHDFRKNREQAIDDLRITIKRLKSERRAASERARTKAVSQFDFGDEKGDGFE